MMTTAQKFLAATAGIIGLYWFLKPSEAQAATTASTPSTPSTTPHDAAVSSGPQAGDQLLVQTQQTGLAGSLYVRSGAGMTYPEVTYVAHGSKVIATGNSQTDSSGVAWWEVQTPTGQKGWSESIYLYDLGPAKGA
jgi:hypothetical protein